MFRCILPQRTVETIAENLTSGCLRQQRAQAFYQYHRGFGTRATLRQSVAATVGDEHDSPSVTSQYEPVGVASAAAQTPAMELVGTPSPPTQTSSKATSTPAPVVKSRRESRAERKMRRITAGTYKLAASAMEKQEEEQQRVQSVLAKLDDLEEPVRPQFEDATPQTPKIDKESREESKSDVKQVKRESARASRLSPKPKREPWELQKDALEHKFGETGWQPRKRLSPDTLDGIRALHASDPAAYSTETLSEHFKIAPEAIRRILKSKWRPNEGETEDRRVRWERRGVKKWKEMSEMGMRPPVKWRAMGVGGAEGVVEERMPKRKKVRRASTGLSWDEVTGGVMSDEQRSSGSLADRLL